MVRVLRHDSPPEERELTAEELEASYGLGTFLSEQSVYLCALPVHLRPALEKINSARGLPQIPSDSDAQRSFFIWLFDVGRAVPDLRTETDSLLTVFSSSSVKWAECVRAAAAAAAVPPLKLVTPALRPPKEPIVAQSLKAALLEGWDRDYEDPLGVVGYLAGVVDEYMTEWEGGRHFAAWTMVLQSSGWGKSRSILELAIKGFHVAYASFMRPRATGIPERSPVADVLLGVDAKDPRCIAAWVVAILSQIGQLEPVSWRTEQGLEVSEPEELRANRRKELAGKVSESYKKLKDEVILTVPDYSPRPGEPWQADQLREWIKRKLCDDNTPQRKVVFCLDEAASLFKEHPESFVAFRRFFSAIPTQLKLFGLLADTAGKLGQVFPQRMSDPSARALDPTAKSFQPVWVVGSSWRNPKELRRLLSEQKDVAAVSEEFIRELFKMGRPLWTSLLKASLDSAVMYAVQKLLNGVSLATLECDLALIKPAMATSIIAVAAGLEVGAWAELAQEMVAGHMRSVSHVSGDRERVFTADVIEPILGEAAARILAIPQVLLQVLKIMGGVLKQALVVEGPRGEIVGRLLLALAMHHCCRKFAGGVKEKYSHPVPLGVFLSELSGRTVKAKGFIFFNRFMFLNRREITPKLLLFCFLCGFAIIPKRNQTAFGVLLPRLIPGPDGEYKLQEDRMRAMPVQIRNRQDEAIKTEKLLECLSSSSPAKKKEATQSSNRPQSLSSPPSEREAPKRALRGMRENEEAGAKLDALLDHFSCDRPPKKQRIVSKEEEIELKDECGLYLHVKWKGPRKDVDEVHVTDDGNVLVLRGVRFPFLEESVFLELDNMCHSFFNLQDELQVNPKGKILHHNFNNYFKLGKDEIVDLLLP